MDKPVTILTISGYLGTPRAFLGHTLSYKDSRKYNLGYLGTPRTFLGPEGGLP